MSRVLLTFEANRLRRKRSWVANRGPAPCAAPLRKALAFAREEREVRGESRVDQGLALEDLVARPDDAHDKLEAQDRLCHNPRSSTPSPSQSP